MKLRDEITEESLCRFFSIADRASVILAVLSCSVALGWIIIPAIIRIVGRS